MDNELALRLFVSVVEAKSFSQGGARLGVPQSSASRMISRLEKRLGARLLQRSTRKLTLTEAGLIYFERAARIVTELDEATDAIRDISAAPSGLLRVLAPASFGRMFIAPAMVKFHALYPEINVGLSLSDNVVDLIGVGYDVAIRLGDLQDSNLVATRLSGSISVVCASPDYLHTTGAPSTVDDLVHHNCLQFRSNPGQNTWRFNNDTTKLEVQVNGSFFSDSGDALIAAAVAGLGICYLPEWLAQPHLDHGALKPVLTEYRLEAAVSPIHAVVGYRQHIPAKQKVFVAFLREQLSGMTWAKA